MLDRLAPILKGICLGMAALLAYQVFALVMGSESEAFDGLNVSFSGEISQENATERASVSSSSTRVEDGKLPAEAQSRLELIEKSGMFGALPRPLPLALLGIGGQDAFIRTANGQTGLLRVGEELGGVKLIRIDINQVVVEEDGREKELKLFPGLDGKK